MSIRDLQEVAYDCILTEFPHIERNFIRLLSDQISAFYFSSKNFNKILRAHQIYSLEKYFHIPIFFTIPIDNNHYNFVIKFSSGTPFILIISLNK